MEWSGGATTLSPSYCNRLSILSDFLPSLQTPRTTHAPNNSPIPVLPTFLSPTWSNFTTSEGSCGQRRKRAADIIVGSTLIIPSLSPARLGLFKS